MQERPDQDVDPIKEPADLPDPTPKDPVNDEPADDAPDAGDEVQQDHA